MSKKKTIDSNNTELKILRKFEHLSPTDLSQSLDYIYSPWLKSSNENASQEERKTSHEAGRSINSRVHGTTIGRNKS